MGRLANIMFAGLGAAALLACGSNDAHNIGEVGVTGARLSDYAGNWGGYVEAYEFLDLSDGIRIQLDEDGHGVVEVGDHDPLPEPDPTKGYPPVDGFFAPDGRPLQRAPIAAGLPASLVPGFGYPVSDADVEDNRIRLSFHSNDLYAQWCAGMDPVYDEYNSLENDEEVYGCLANGSTGSFEDDDGHARCTLDDEPIDCGLLQCEQVCTCDAEGCAVHEAEPDVRFDGALEDGKLVGTLVLDERLTVRLTRD